MPRVNEAVLARSTLELLIATDGTPVPGTALTQAQQRVLGELRGRGLVRYDERLGGWLITDRGKLAAREGNPLAAGMPVG